MDAKLKADWTAALRSGEYKQGRRRFRIESAGGVKHCCLGVLCEVAGAPIEQGPSNDNYEFVGRALGAVNPADLWRMNDTQGKSFSEIADWIDTNIPED